MPGFLISEIGKLCRYISKNLQKRFCNPLNVLLSTVFEVENEFCMSDFGFSYINKYAH